MKGYWVAHTDARKAEKPGAENGLEPRAMCTCKTTAKIAPGAIWWPDLGHSCFRRLGVKPGSLLCPLLLSLATDSKSSEREGPWPGLWPGPVPQLGWLGKWL